MERKEKEKDIYKKVRELIRESAAHMRKNIKRALSCGAIDIDSHQNNYLIPKIIFQALLKEEEFQYKLHFKEYNDSAENLYNML